MKDWRPHWQSRVKLMPDPHFAKAGTTLRSTAVDASVGEFISVGIVGSNERVYAFHGQANRDRFVNLYRPHGAKPCKDPYP